MSCDYSYTTHIATDIIGDSEETKICFDPDYSVGSFSNVWYAISSVIILLQIVATLVFEILEGKGLGGTLVEFRKKKNIMHFILNLAAAIWATVILKKQKALYNDTLTSIWDSDKKRASLPRICQCPTRGGLGNETDCPPVIGSVFEDAGDPIWTMVLGNYYFTMFLCAFLQLAIGYFPDGINRGFAESACCICTRFMCRDIWNRMSTDRKAKIMDKMLRVVLMMYTWSGAFGASGFSNIDLNRSCFYGAMDMKMWRSSMTWVSGMQLGGGAMLMSAMGMFHCSAGLEGGGVLYLFGVICTLLFGAAMSVGVYQEAANKLQLLEMKASAFFTSVQSLSLSGSLPSSLRAADLAVTLAVILGFALVGFFCNKKKRDDEAGWTASLDESDLHSINNGRM